jgi:aryl-alcohol dehydrogenase-like predicted oxidoreductase
MSTSTTPDLVRIGASDLEVLPLSLGGNVFGWTADEATSFEVLDAFAAAGGNLIDTADGYSAWVEGNTGGESETIIGRWLRARGNRDGLVIATKVSTHPQVPGLAPGNVRAAAEASLRRLQVDRLDVYYAHFDDLDTPLEDTVAAFSALVDDGLVRHLALSNYAPDRIDAWFEITEREGFHRPIALQPHYNLVERGFEAGLRERAEREGLAVFPYSALASGFLTGKYRDGATGDSPRAEGAAGYLDDRGRAVLAALDEVAAVRGTTVTAVSLAWLRQQPTVVATIASARTVDQLADLLASTRLTLDPDELSALDAASRPA